MVAQFLIWLFLLFLPHTLLCETNETFPFESVDWELVETSKFALDQQTVVKAFNEINKFIRQAQKYGCSREQILTLIEREYGIEVIDAIKRINILQKDIDAIWWNIVTTGFVSGITFCGLLVLCWYIWPWIASIKLPRPNGYGGGYGGGGGFGGGLSGGFGDSGYNDNSFGGGGLSASLSGGDLNGGLSVNIGNNDASPMNFDASGGLDNSIEDSSLIFSPGSPLILPDEEPPTAGGNADYINFED